METATEPCYLRHSLIPVEEDLTHEFKAHRDLSNTDLSTSKYSKAIGGGITPKLPRSRATLSKAICGMLNTGLKSTMYLGITDDGRAEGLMMSLYQKDHFLLSFQDLLSRFNPPCPEHLIDVKFVPIVDPVDNGVVAPESIGLETPRWLEHCIRDSRYCWCDSYTFAACANGIIHRFYIIELTFNAWNKDDPRNRGLLRDDVFEKRPIFANETGKVYIRRNGYTIPVLGSKDMLTLKSTDFNAASGINIPNLDSLIDSDSDEEYFSYESNLSEID